MKLSPPLFLLGLLLGFPAWADRPADPRSFEVLRYDCASELGRREVTFFLNGTVRLREGPPGKEDMGLAELNPDQRDGAVRRIKEEDLSEARNLPRGVDGSWVEKCMLAIQLPDKPIQVFHFGRYDTLPLNLSRVVRVAEDLGAEVKSLQGSEELPPDYEPQRMDVLKRVDGHLYRIIRFTDDGKGIELQGTEQPLALYVHRDQLRLEFVKLVSRAK
ncbi:MAG TPA: hypothetical protein VF756_17915 [Thermoanaerobaculia bacterium]